MSLEFAINIMVIFQGAIFSMLGYHMVAFNKLVRRVDRQEWRIKALVRKVLRR